MPNRSTPMIRGHQPDKNAERNDRDVLLVQRIMDGDPSALETLLTLYTPRLVSFAKGMVHDEDLAEEIVQDTFIALWERRAQLGIGNSVASYLYRAVRNRSVSILRHETSQARLRQNILSLYPTLSHENLNEGIRSLDDHDVQTLVRRALRGAPPRSREIFLLSWEHNLTYQEIASLLGIGVPSVKKQLYRATRQLAEYLLRHKLDIG